jgi:hypothetical protein
MIARVKSWLRSRVRDTDSAGFFFCFTLVALLALQEDHWVIGLVAGFLALACLIDLL